MQEILLCDCHITNACLYQYFRREVQAAVDRCIEAEQQRDSTINSHAVDVKTAVHQARLNEREILGKTIDRYKGKTKKLSSKITSLSNLTADALSKARTSTLRANQSAQRTQGLMSATTSLQQEVQDLCKQLSKQQEDLLDLVEQLETKKKELTAAEEAVPIREFGKVREGNRGQATWPLYVWELIIEQLVNGTPPSSVNPNIVTFIKKLSPSIVIHELPSIWTIQRAQTVLLAIVQTLATYHIAKAGKWEQMFTDGTSHKQVTFQDLIITVEEDEFFV